MSACYGAQAKSKDCRADPKPVYVLSHDVKKRTEPHPRNPGMGRASVALHIVFSVSGMMLRGTGAGWRPHFVGFLEWLPGSWSHHILPWFCLLFVSYHMQMCIHIHSHSLSHTLIRKHWHSTQISSTQMSMWDVKGTSFFSQICACTHSIEIFKNYGRISASTSCPRYCLLFMQLKLVVIVTKKNETRWQDKVTGVWSLERVEHQERRHGDS